MRYNAKDQTSVSIDGKDVDDVDSFTYLGAIVNKTGGAEQDITARVGKARSSFNKLTKVWKSSQYSRRTKTRIFNSNVLTVLLYGSETWRMTKRDEKKLDSFQHICLRKILKIHWPMKVTNEEVRKRAGSERLSTQIRTRRWTWIGHVLRMKPDLLPRTALNWAPEGKRKRGRPRETWRRTIEKERSQGETCLQQFTTWLDYRVEETGRPLTVLAHNFQGYDSYPLVEEYHCQKRVLEQTRNGAKILQLKVGGHSLH